jgi:hypothetical protein
VRVPETTSHSSVNPAVFWAVIPFPPFGIALRPSAVVPMKHAAITAESRTRIPSSTFPEMMFRAELVSPIFAGDSTRTPHTPLPTSIIPARSTPM